MKKVRKAVIAVAGFGTRFLPVTKATPKEMLPIIDKPIVQYIVEELAASGIEEIILVTNWQKKAVEDHFAPSLELEQHLTEQGKRSLAQQMKRISKLARFFYIRQMEGYGNALPAMTVRDFLDGEPFIYAFGDDLVKATVPFTKQLIQAFQKHECSVIGVQEVSSKEVSKYGIVKLRGETQFVDDIIEKPSPKNAPSRLAVFGRYLFTPDIFDALDKTKAGKGDEFWISDAIKILSKDKPVATQKVKGGRWLTTGDPISYFRAILEYAADRPELKEQIKSYL